MAAADRKVRTLLGRDEAAGSTWRSRSCTGRASSSSTSPPPASTRRAAARSGHEVGRLAQEDGVTVFLTTQYLEEADVLANRVGIIDHGRIVAEGTPAELKAEIGIRPSRRFPPIPSSAPRCRGSSRASAT